MTESYRHLPADIPVPIDDGAADHLRGMEVPAITLSSTLGEELDLAAATERLAVVYVYPRTGVPGELLPAGWDEIPGARGCTPQSCAFRDHVLELAAYGASVLGVSAQPHAEQREFAGREHIPYPLLSDPDLQAGARARAAHVRGRRPELLPAPHLHRASTARREGVLPRVPAAPQPCRGARLAGGSADLEPRRLRRG